MSELSYANTGAAGNGLPMVLNNYNSFPHNPVNRSGAEYPLLGLSPSIQRIQSQIEFAARTNYPVFISGETGTEKRSIASLIHLNRLEGKGRFILIPPTIHNQSQFKAYLESSLNRAKQGTLYLSEVDVLPQEKKDYLTTLFSQEEFQSCLTEKKVQLIVSCTESINSAEGNRQFLAKLLGTEVPHLELHIPPVRERKQDLSNHIDHILNKLQSFTTTRFTPEAIQLLHKYHWPGNVEQLQRVIVTLVSCCNNNIDVEDIQNLDLFPESETFDIVEAVLSQEFSGFRHLHPGLLKALNYMSENFTEELTLADLSNAAFTSQSHLSYLFRQHIGYSFKSLLVQVRICYAKQLIDQSPMMKVTEVCLQSGFGDLSHFEKMFKRNVGCTPRQYRQKEREKARLFATN